MLFKWWFDKVIREVYDRITPILPILWLYWTRVCWICSPCFFNHTAYHIRTKQVVLKLLRWVVKWWTPFYNSSRETNKNKHTNQPIKLSISTYSFVLLVFGLLNFDIPLAHRNFQPPKAPRGVAWPTPRSRPWSPKRRRRPRRPRRRPGPLRPFRARGVTSRWLKKKNGGWGSASVLGKIYGGFGNCK